MFKRNFINGSLSLSHYMFKSFQNVHSRFLSNPKSLRNPKTLIKIPRNRPQILRAQEFRYDLDQSLPEFVPVPDSCSSDVKSICSLLSDSSQTRDFDDLLKCFKNKLDSDLVLGILTNYRILGRKNTLNFFSWAGFQLGFSFSDSVIEFMADFLGRRKLFDDLKFLLKTVSSRNGSVSSRTISIFIRFLGRQGRIKEAICVFDAMESEFGCKPDNLVFNNMLYVLCKKISEDAFRLMGYIDVAFSVFQRIEHPDTYSYSNFIIGLCKSGRLETAQEVFYEMCNAGLVPTRTAINILIGELCENSSIEKVRVGGRCQSVNILVPIVGKRRGVEPAVEVFWTIYDLGLFPSAFVVNLLITKLCRLRKFEEGMEILKIVEDRKLRCLSESYTIVIEALCQVLRLDETCELFGRMISQGLNPKLGLYNSVISALCKSGDLMEAQQVFDLMNKKRCAPDNVTYTSLINGHCRDENWEAAYGLLMEMLGLGWLPHLHTYNMVDSLVKRHGRIDLCEKLEGKVEIQILHNHCKAGELDAAYEKLSSMIAKGLHPPIYTRDIFERAFRKAGKWKVSQELLSKIE